MAALLLIGLTILFSDFVTKVYAYYSFPFIDYSDPSYPYGGIGVFKNFVGIECSLGLVINKGAAWGFLSDFQIPLVIARVIVIGGMLVYLIFINQNRLIWVPFVVIIAGAFGNVVDFFLYGFVIDFIHFKFWGYDFPVFNLADTFISLGVVGLFFIGFFHKAPVNQKHNAK